MADARSLLSRIFAPLRRALEGQPRPGPYHLRRSGGWLADGVPINFWQHGYSLEGGGERGAVVEACVSAYSQTVAMCSGDHWRRLQNGGRERVSNSALARILRKPNDYDSISDFLLNLTRSLYLYGNAYALCLRHRPTSHRCAARRRPPMNSRVARS